MAEALTVEGFREAVLALEKNNLDYENEFPEYNPHLTLAYLKKGFVEKYEGKNDFIGKKLSYKMA
jgi:hypothetical protein